MSRLILVTLLVALAGGVSAAEQFYKWKDQNGSWNYSTQPPKDQSATTLNIATGASGTTEPASAGEKPAEAPAGGGKGGPSKEMSMADAADAMARIKQTQNANCERARTNVATLENNPRVQMDRGDGAGNRPLKDEEQLQELQKARRQVEVFCNSR